MELEVETAQPHYLEVLVVEDKSQVVRVLVHSSQDPLAEALETRVETVVKVATMVVVEVVLENEAAQTGLLMVEMV